jgi:PAS domain S-box-containing protein
MTRASDGRRDGRLSLPLAPAEESGTVSPDPTLIQAAFAIPIISGLAAYTLFRWDRSILHLLLAAVLTSVVLWLGGMAIKLSPGPHWLANVGLDLEVGAIIFMPPLFMMTMAYFSRSTLFESSHGPAISVFAVSSLFLAAYWTNDSHQLFFADRMAALSPQGPAAGAGPIFWALQIWCATCSCAGIAYCGRMMINGRTRSEKGRAAMIVGAAAIPVLAHFLHMLQWLPFDYSLAPGTIALTAVFFVQGVHRYGLLGGQSIVRHDLIEHLDDGLILTDEQGTVLDANRAAEHVLRLERHQLRGMLLPDVIALFEPDRASDDIAARILALPLDGSRVGAEIHTVDDRTIEVTGGAVPTLGLQPAGRFISIEDRSDQRRSEKLLRERQKLESVGILAAGVAHEVNNPLAYVRSNLVHLRGLAESLSKHLGPVDRGEIGEMPEVIEESIEGLDRIARIVESLLRFSRTSDEAQSLVDVDMVVDEALRLAALQRSTVVRVERRRDPVPPVLGNAERLVQVLLNLFLNAKQVLADRTDGVIVAETTTLGDHVLMRVRDNGPGIPESLQQRIFDPFFTTRAPDSGTGLGLSIAFDIVRDHGGTLDVTSKVGVGSCFTVRLAAMPPDEAGV